MADDEMADQEKAGLEKAGLEMVEKSEDEWRAQLSPEAYRVLRQAGTERAWSGEYVDWHGNGTFSCRACGNKLFSSATKFKSGSGWPSFWQPLSDGAVEVVEDRSHGMRRVEVRCARCRSHLGHVFDDGPAPTGQRFCMNSLSLQVEQDEHEAG